MFNPAFPVLLRYSLLSLLASGCVICVTGCGSTSGAGSGNSYAVVSGNWAITPQLSGQSTGQASSQTPTLPTASGSLTRAVNGGVSGIFRLSPVPTCLAATESLSVSGAVDSQGVLRLASQPVNGATWKVTGHLSANGRTLTAATVSVSGGGCSTVAAPANGTLYTPISGTYSGSFTDASGTTVPVSTTLTQTSAPDHNGQFHLSGNAAFPTNSCFTSPAVTDSLVTGNTLSAAYSQQQGTVISTVTASGTFNADATTLTISNYAVAGGNCDGDRGVGLLTKQ